MPQDWTKLAADLGRMLKLRAIPFGMNLFETNGSDPEDPPGRAHARPGTEEIRSIWESWKVAALAGQRPRVFGSARSGSKVEILQDVTRVDCSE
jgi:hypothetical protein